MATSMEVPIRRLKDRRIVAAADTIITEARIELDVNDGQARRAMLCLPDNLEDLAVGFLHGEGALRSLDDLDSVEYLPDEQRISIRGDFDADVVENMALRWTWGSGCGSGGTSRDMNSPAFAALRPGPEISADKLLELTKRFSDKTTLWRQTGGVHACALADMDDLLTYAEDVGRHNAFDKAIGMAIREGIDPTDKIMLTTGRLSAEIVSKAVASRVPILASRSAVTSLAVQAAGRFGLTLVGFVRGRRLNVYTRYERIGE